MESGSSVRGRRFILGVGAQKAGTSWVHEHLAGVPGVMVTPVKEMHFFETWLMDGDDGLRKLRRKSRAAAARIANNYSPEKADVLLGVLDRSIMHGPDDYFAHFARIAESDTNTFVDITPAYALLSEDQLRRVASEFRARELDLRVVFLMRDPIDRLASAVRMSMAKEPSRRSFAERFDIALGMPYEVARGRYELQVPAMRNAFGEDSVFVDFYETFFDGTTCSFDALVTFLGIPRTPPKLSDRVHTYDVPRVQLPRELYESARRVYAPTYEYVAGAFGARVPPAWAGANGD